VRPAIADFDKAYKLNGSDVELLLLLARAYWQVIDVRRDSYGRSPNTDLGKAVKVLSAAMRAAPNDMRAFWLMFRMGVEPVKERELLLPYAKAVVARLTRTKAGSLDFKLMQAELALAESKHIDAKRLVAVLRSAAPSDKRVRMLSIRLDVESRWEALNANEQAALIRKARALVVAEPGSIEAIRLLTRALERAGKTGEVVSIWQLLHRKRPGDLRVAAAYSEQLVKAKKYSQAADVLA